MTPRPSENAFPISFPAANASASALLAPSPPTPPILLMDEPFGALDPITRSEVQREFLSIRATLGKTIVFVTHDVREGLRFADRIAVMESGKVAWEGTPGNFRAAEDTRIRPYLESLQ